ncbi:MAG TPA: UDP-glucose 4-epimerase GalE [Lentisphaeria bacterium]|nr:MAG: UDP-glucose 4-epimerase GalE [Lentisphaerae bacterium GWF2_49_21]HBC88077.1 UDP-glucose 4-epimerase GalE [Lentisphaeria bacterium]
MKILVTGGAGYIGSACTEYLLDKGYKVTVFDSLVTGHRGAVDKRAEFVKGDLADRELIISVLKKGGFDGIMHFAAYSLVGESMTNPGKYFQNNLGAGINLLDGAVEGKVKSFVFSSTCATYGEPTQIPIPETEKQSPINAYGESKLMFEKALKWYNQIFGIKYAALRYFNAAGATKQFGEDHSPETHLVPLVLKVALGKMKSIKIFGEDYQTPDGTCIRDYIHILDLAQAHELALSAPRSGHYNLGTGNGYSVKQIIDVSRKVTGHAIPADIVERRPGDPPRLIGCSALAKKELGWKPQFENVEAVIQSAWDWTKKNPEGYKK